MNRLSKATAALLLGASVSLFAADVATTATGDTATAITEVEAARDGLQQGHVMRNAGVQQGDESVQYGTEAGNAAGENLSFYNDSVNDEIEKIKNANPEQRRELMNQFKNRLAHMNREERMQALEELRQNMQLMNREQTMEHDNPNAAKEMAQMGIGQGAQAAQPGTDAGMGAAQMGAQQGALSAQQAVQVGADHAQSGAQSAQMMGSIPFERH